MYKAEERSYRVYRVTWDTVRDGAKNYPVLEGELGGYVNQITVDLNSFDPDEGVEIDLLGTGRSFMMTLDECAKHGYFSRFCELRCTVVETVYRAYGSHGQAHSSIRIQFTMTTPQLIRTLRLAERVVLPDVVRTEWRWKDALDSDIAGLEETEIMILGHIGTATGALRFGFRPYGIAIDVTGHATPAAMTIIEKGSLRRWDVLVSDFCRVLREYNGKDTDESVAVIFDVEAKKIRQILNPGDRVKIQACGLDKGRLFTFENVRIEPLGGAPDTVAFIKISPVSPTIESSLREFYAKDCRGTLYGKNPHRYQPKFDHDDKSVIIGVFTGYADYKARFNDMVERAQGSSYVNLTIRYDFGMLNPTVESSKSSSRIVVSTETIFSRSAFAVDDEAKLIANGCWSKAPMDATTERYLKALAKAYLAEIPSTYSGRYPWVSGESSAQIVPGIKKVYFNKPATVVIWEDDSKTIVKCQPGEKYDAEKGLAMAIAKKALGNTGKWYDTFKKELPKPKKRSSAKKGATDETA